MLGKWLKPILKGVIFGTIYYVVNFLFNPSGHIGLTIFIGVVIITLMDILTNEGK